MEMLTTDRQVLTLHTHGITATRPGISLTFTRSIMAEAPGVACFKGGV
jgi:hypothetical protein